MNDRFFVYCLYSANVIVYVGSTTDIDTRINNHRTDKVFDSVKYCELPTYEIMLSFEGYGISKLKPAYNKVLPSFCEDLDLAINWFNYEFKNSIPNKTLPEYTRTCQKLTVPSSLLSVNKFFIGDNSFTLSLTDKVIYCYLWQHFTNAWSIPSYGDIGLDLGLTSKTVCRTMQYFKNIGVLKLENTSGKKVVLASLEKLE